MSSPVFPSSAPVAPLQVIDEIRMTKADEPDFDLCRLSNQIDDQLAFYDTKLRKKSPFPEKLGEQPLASKASNFEDQVSASVDLISDKIKKYFEDKNQTIKEVLNAFRNVHEGAIGFLVVGAALKIARTIENNKKCLILLYSMNNLSKAILKLQKFPDLKMDLDNKVAKSTPLMLEGAILGYSQKEYKRSKVQQLIRNIKNICKTIYLEISTSTTKGSENNVVVKPTAIPTLRQDTSKTSRDSLCQMEVAERETKYGVDEIAASSSKPMQNGSSYVFINHSGCHTIRTNIYHALEQAGYRAIIDVEEMESADLLQERIRSASLHIPIISRHYIQSPRCLAELSLMLKTGKPIVPVFYFVEPRELRFVSKGEGLYPLFSEHEKGRYSISMLEEWTKSLAAVSFLSGYMLDTYEDKRKLEKDIVKYVSLLMKNKPARMDWKISSISRVYQDLRALRPETYDPRIVGLGIFHHNTSQHLFETRQEKVKALCSTAKSLKVISVEEKVKALCTTAKRLEGISVHNLVNDISTFDHEIRDCYTDNEDSFPLEIIGWSFAMDACFILEFFRSVFWFSDKDTEREIMKDIFKAENQIPLPILLRILELEFQTREEAISKLANMLCMQPRIAILPFSLKPMGLRSLQADFERNINQGACHLLHLLSKSIEDFLQPSNISTDDTSMDTVADFIDFMSLVVDTDMDRVQKFLIRFKPSKDGHIQFRKGLFGSAVLYLPQIYLSKESEPFFLNLIAFTIGSTNNIINHFIFFMKCIINLSNKNVSLLKKKQVIMSEMRDEELDAMFKSLSHVISESCGPFENIWNKVTDHYNKPSNKKMLWFASLLFRLAITGFFMLLFIGIFVFAMKW